MPEMDVAQWLLAELKAEHRELRIARWLLAEKEWELNWVQADVLACNEIAGWLIAERDWALDQLAHDIVTSDHWNHIETGAELLAYIRDTQ